MSGAGHPRRWKAGSAERNKLRADAQRTGVCTTCLGQGHWWSASSARVHVKKVCQNCGGSGDGPQKDHPPTTPLEAS